jgi:hypothetical protein
MGKADELLEMLDTFESDTCLFELLIPKPFRNDLEWSVMDAIVTDPKLCHRLPLLQVRTEHLTPTQAFIDQDKVRKMRREGHFDGLFVVKRNGSVYVIDGHHRLEAAKLANKPTIWCYTLKMPSQPVDNIDWFSNRLRRSNARIGRKMHPTDRKEHIV